MPSFGLWLWTVVGVALALDGNDQVRLELAGGAVVEGRFLRAEPGAVILSNAAQGAVAVPLVIVEGASLNGAPMGLEAFRAEAAAAWELRASLLAESPSAPPAAVVAGMSMLWAGAGHAALGEWRAFGGYSAAEAIIWGTVVFNLANEEVEPVPTLIALDLIVRAWAAQESARIAKRRREIRRAAEAAAQGP